MANETDAPQLSERERQVLQMVATGASNQQIARQLVISVNTVKVHLRNIYEKLEVQSRTEAVMYAAREGWVAVSEDSDAAPEAAAKTFLITNKQPALGQWQQIYLMFAILLALATVTTPLILKDAFGKESSLSLESILSPILKEGNEIYGEVIETPPPPQIEDPNRWAFQSPMPTNRAGLGVAVFEGRIFAIGGIKSKNIASRLVEIYDPMANSTNSSPWKEGENKPTATTDISAVVLDDKIYVPGGCSYKREAINNLEIYDPHLNQWAQGQALPEPRCGYGLVAFQDKLYLFGGWNGKSFEDTVFAYFVEKDNWEILDSKMPEAKGYVGAAVLDGTIYVVGGYDGQSEFKQTYVFVPETGEWLEKSPLREPRGGLGLISVAGQLYAIGGGWKQPVTSSENYNPATNTWDSFEAPFAEQWRNSGLAAIGGTIYAIGGWNDTEGKYMDSVVSYQVVYQLFLPISTFGE